MKEPSTFVGLDAHKDSISVALLRPGSRQAQEWKIVNEPKAVRRLARRLIGEGDVAACYEAGPGGYFLQRQLAQEGITCAVIAPSLIPVKPGQPIKTDRRDARKLAELFRAGLLTEVHPPSEDEEAVRDLCRCRDDAQRDLTRARNRLNKFLLRRGRVYTVGRRPTWSQKYWSWLRGQSFEREADRVVFEDYLLTVQQADMRVEALEREIERCVSVSRIALPSPHCAASTVSIQSPHWPWLPSCMILSASPRPGSSRPTSVLYPPKPAAARLVDRAGSRVPATVT